MARDPLEVQVVCEGCVNPDSGFVCYSCAHSGQDRARLVPGSYPALLMELGRLTANYREDLLGTERRLQLSAYEAAHAAVRAHPDHQEGA